VFRQSKFFFPLLALLLVVVMICAIGFGTVKIMPGDMWYSLVHYFRGQPQANIYEGVLLCALTGAVLSVSGVLMQGLFRNPIVEPGLVGTSSGAAFGAAIVFVIAEKFSPGVKSVLGPFLMPVMAFLGGLTATFLVYSLARNSGRTSIMSILLVGIAVNAVCISGIGFMSYIARDPQARSITFFSLGYLSGASWLQVMILSSVAAIMFAVTLSYSKQLNALLLGEEEAAYLGVDTNKLKRRVLILNTAMVAVATAFVGVISFVGLIVPHVLRLLIGSDNKKLLPAAILMGAALLTLADLAARLVLAPAELPIGVVTSLVGAPVFIILLKKFNILQQKGGGNA
jgi:iron complex transport system permease protein